MQVSKATEEQRINQQRLLLSVNHKGIILATNADASKAVFGFDAAAMLPGQPLSACIDVFASWRDRFGDEASLLQMLAAQAMAASTEGAAACRQAGGAWRVGVHKPAIPGLSSSLAPSAAPLVGVDGDGGAALQVTLRPRHACVRVCRGMTLKLTFAAPPAARCTRAPRPAASCTCCSSGVCCQHA